jgi:hypothetical protein
MNKAYRITDEVKTNLDEIDRRYERILRRRRLSAMGIVLGIGIATIGTAVLLMLIWRLG